MLKQRNHLIDIAKYVCMLSVILGHFLQCLKYGIIDAPKHWNDYLFKTVCSFEIPLFIAISGYFAYSSLNKTKSSDYFKSRMKYLLIPLALWSLLKVGFQIILDSNIFSLEHYCYTYIQTLTSQLWFIWAIIYSTIIIITLKKCKLDNIYCLIIVAFLLKAIQFNFFCYSSFKDVFIFFAIGYWFAKQDKARYGLVFKKLFPLFLLISIIGIICWEPSYILHPVLSVSYWARFIYNIVLSTSCSIVVLTIIHYVYNWTANTKISTLIANVGTETLGIYFLQDYFFSFYGYRFNGKFYLELNNIILVIISIIFVFICYCLIKIIDKNKLLSFLLLGKKTY